MQKGLGGSHRGELREFSDIRGIADSALYRDNPIVIPFESGSLFTPQKILATTRNQWLTITKCSHF